MRRSASMLVMLSLWGCNCDDPQFTQKRCEYRGPHSAHRLGPQRSIFSGCGCGPREETTIRIENVGNTALPQSEIQWRDGTGENVKAQFESLPVITEPIGTGAVVDVTVTYAPITAVSAGGQSHRGTVRFTTLTSTSRCAARPRRTSRSWVPRTRADAAARCGCHRCRPIAGRSRYRLS